MTENIQAKKSSGSKFLWLGLIAVIVVAGGIWAGFTTMSQLKLPEIIRMAVVERTNAAESEG